MIDKYNYNDEPSGRVDTLAMALDKCERLEKQLIETKDSLTTALDKCNRLEKELIKAKNILADLTFSAPCDSILHRQIKEKAERFFREIKNEDRNTNI
jgi:hypothetical protein